jgi:hypothetical protein
MMSAPKLETLAQEIADQTYPSGRVDLRNQLAQRILAALEQVERASYAKGVIAARLAEQARAAELSPRAHVDAIGTNGGKVTVETRR